MALLLLFLGKLGSVTFDKEGAVPLDNICIISHINLYPLL